jgi:hypothetical protein
MANERRRRTERLFLRYPLRVEGFDSQGKKFEESTHTIVVNRHGGRVLLKAVLTPGQTVKVIHAVSGRAADFRVVGLAGAPTPAGGEWGMECRDDTVNFWGITFPPMDESADSSSALLECSQCHDVALTAFSMVEYDLLENNASLVRDCHTCREQTKWVMSLNPTRIPSADSAGAPVGFPPESGPPATAAGEGLDPRAQSIPLPFVTYTEKRRSPRVSLRLPLRVRNAKDATDLTKSENICKGGVAFTSDKLFEVDELLEVTCPYNPAGGNIEVSGRVVRREEVSGTGRYLYGIEFQR